MGNIMKGGDHHGKVFEGVEEKCPDCCCNSFLHQRGHLYGRYI